ncbi:MAG: nitroreductase family protein [Bacillota bacterium]
MPLKTCRGDDFASVFIDKENCTVCGLCVKVCKGDILHTVDGEVEIDLSRLFGCIGCGQCMAVCPKNCITVQGRCLSMDSLTELPEYTNKTDYEQLKALMLGRRSVRDYKDREIEQEVIDKILDAARTAPMGIPPSEVHILVLKGRDKVREFSNDMVDYMQKTRWLFQPPAAYVYRPFIGKASYELIQGFMLPLIDVLHRKRKENSDWLLYSAPLAMLFHASPYADPVDPHIPATYAMLAAESMGLGSCMIGSVAPFLKYSKKIKAKYKIKPQNQMGIVVVFGYPAVRYTRSLKRDFAEVQYY